jgi:hypothetical protein
MKKNSNLLNKLTLFLTLFGVSLGLHSCNEVDKTETKTQFNLVTAKAEIEHANKEFMDLVAAGDSVGLANAYTIDAKFMNGGAPATVDRKNIQTAMKGMVESGLTSVDQNYA